MKGLNIKMKENKKRILYDKPDVNNLTKRERELIIQYLNHKIDYFKDEMAYLKDAEFDKLSHKAIVELKIIINKLK